MFDLFYWVLVLDWELDFFFEKQKKKKQNKKNTHI